MRLSVNDLNKYDEKKLALSRRAVILLDGVQVKNCTEADEENGFIVRFKLTGEGSLILNGSEIETEKLTGHVQIIDPLEKQQ